MLSQKKGLLHKILFFTKPIKSAKYINNKIELNEYK